MQALPRRIALLAAAVFSLGLPVAHGQATEEVPFITTPDNVTLEMLRVAAVGPQDHVIDLGSGDGRIVILAAKRFGASGLGVEIVPDLVQQSVRNAREAGVAERVSFRVQDLFQTDLSPATVITMYLLPEVNLQLLPKLLALKPGTRLVSHDWDLGDWKPDQTTVVKVPDKKVGLEKSSKIHLWVVPAAVEGLWCSHPTLPQAYLQIRQRFQQVQSRLVRTGSPVVEGQGRMQGGLLRFEPRGGAAPLLLEAVDDQLRATSRGPGPQAGGFPVFVRAQGGRCPPR